MSKIERVSELVSEAKKAETKQIQLTAEVVIDAIKNNDKAQLLQLIGTVSGMNTTAIGLLLAIRDQL